MTLTPPPIVARMSPTDVVVPAYPSKGADRFHNVGSRCIARNTGRRVHLADALAEHWTPCRRCWP